MVYDPIESLLHKVRKFHFLLECGDNEVEQKEIIEYINMTLTNIHLAVDREFVIANNGNAVERGSLDVFMVIASADIIGNYFFAYSGVVVVH